MNLDQVGRDLTAAVNVATEAMLASGEAGDAYALALSMAEDGMGIGLCWTTESHFRAYLAEQEAEPEDELYYRWAVAEWLHEGWQDDLFAGINEAVSSVAISDGLSDAEFDGLVGAMTAALAGLRERWRAEFAEITMFITVSDSDDAEELENSTAEKLNPAALRDRFLARFEDASKGTEL